MSHNQNPVLKCKELRRRISAAISGWDCPLLTFIYPGFDCGSHVFGGSFIDCDHGFRCLDRSRAAIWVAPADVPHTSRKGSSPVRFLATIIQSHSFCWAPRLWTFQGYPLVSLLGFAQQKKKDPLAARNQTPRAPPLGGCRGPHPRGAAGPTSGPPRTGAAPWRSRSSPGAAARVARARCAPVGGPFLSCSVTLEKKGDPSWGRPFVYSGAATPPKERGKRVPLGN